MALTVCLVPGHGIAIQVFLKVGRVMAEAQGQQQQV
jgi:hypothetical protein